MHTRPEGDTLDRHLFHAAVDLPLLELEIRDAVAHQPADAVLTVEQGDVMAGAGELLRAGHARRPRSDDSDALAGLARRHLRHDPALREAADRKSTRLNSSH